MCFILKMNLILNEFCAKIIYNKSSNLFINKRILLMTNSTEAKARIKINIFIKHTGYKNMQKWSIYE